MIKTIADRCGFDIRRRERGHVWHRDVLKDQQQLLEASPAKVIFDVGANEGQTVAKYRAVFPNATIYSFEPFAESFSKLAEHFANDQQVKPQRLAISSSDGYGSLFVNEFSLTNSLLPVDPRSKDFVSDALTRNVGAVEVQTTTLDRFRDEHAIGQIDILKMDIQGGELKALEGATSLLSTRAVRLITLEVLFAPLYDGQPSFYEIGTFLDSYGYRLFGLYEMVHGGPGGLLWADALFAPANSLGNGS